MTNNPPDDRTADELAAHAERIDAFWARSAAEPADEGELLAALFGRQQAPAPSAEPNGQRGPVVADPGGNPGPHTSRDLDQLETSATLTALFGNRR